MHTHTHTDIRTQVPHSGLCLRSTKAVSALSAATEVVCSLCQLCLVCLFTGDEERDATLESLRCHWWRQEVPYHASHPQVWGKDCRKEGKEGRCGGVSRRDGYDIVILTMNLNVSLSLSHTLHIHTCACACIYTYMSTHTNTIHSHM